jgi:signal peptidase I
MTKKGRPANRPAATGQKKRDPEEDRSARKKESIVNAGTPGTVRFIVENLEALTVAFIMALLVRQFVLEAFKIPSDSMFPTLNGETTNGDRVIVDKWTYILGEPRRWDVVVFKYPLDIRRNFIKRLVGMPGDRLTVVDGDLWVNQRIERKPDRVQRSIWIERFPEVPNYSRPPDRCRFKVTDSGWKGKDDYFTGSPAAGKTIRLDLDLGTPVYFDGYYPPGYNDIRDWRIRGEASVAAGAAMGVELRVRDLHFKVRLAAEGGTSSVEFERDRYPVKVIEEKGKDLTLPAESFVDFEVAHWDWRFEVRVDGEVWFAYELDPAPWTIGRKGVAWPAMFKVEPCVLALTATGGRVAFEDLGVDQDLHYTQGGIWDTKNYVFLGKKLEEGKLPDGYYFMMGDNSHGSRDSRLWHRIQVKDPNDPKGERTIWGEEYSWALDSDMMFNQNLVNFVDLYGNGYSIPGFDRLHPDDPTRSPAVLKYESYGLIPRDHLVGRALCVFWPFPPASSEFRPKFVR